MALLRERGSGRGQHREELPDGVLSSLGDMPDDDFARLVFEQRRWIARWRESGDVDALHHMADALSNLGTAPTDRLALGLAQYCPTVVGGVSGFVAGKLLSDTASGAPVGTVLGAASQAALTRRPSETRAPASLHYLCGGGAAQVRRASTVQLAERLRKAVRGPAERARRKDPCVGSRLSGITGFARTTCGRQPQSAPSADSTRNRTRASRRDAPASAPSASITSAPYPKRS